MNASHLTNPPDPLFWRDLLLLGRFDEVVARRAEVEALLDEAYRTPGARRLADEIAVRSGGGETARLNLALAGAFVDFKRTAAVETVAATLLPPDLVEHYRTASGAVRRHAVGALVFERDPMGLLAMELWHLHHARRSTKHRLERRLTHPVTASPSEWEAAARSALEGARTQAPATWCGFDEVRAFAGPAGEVIVGLREWPCSATGRAKSGGVITVDLPEWTLLRVHQGGERLDVTDRHPDRAPALAGRVLELLRPGAGPYVPVLEELSPAKLDEFLEDLTDPQNEVFPLVEIVASVPWRPHHVLTLAGTATHPAEEAVRDLRRVGAFALDWRTVHRVKVRFQDRYKIQVEFPRPGQPVVLSYSDIERDKRVTAAFAELLRHHLHVEVAPKVRGAIRRPRQGRDAAPRKLSPRWWTEVLRPHHEAVDERLAGALQEVESWGLVAVTWNRGFPCGTPYIDRRAAPMDTLDCDGDVLLPAQDGDRDDPCQEDDGAYVCSRGEHRWMPETLARYQVPAQLRALVTHRHEAIWARVLEEVSRFGEVMEVPGRPGVASVRTADAWLFAVYVPLVHGPQELSPETFGRSMPAAWITAVEGQPGVSTRAVHVADVLADAGCLAEVWGVSLTRRRARGEVMRAPLFVAEPAVRYGTTQVIEIDHDGVRLDGNLVCTPQHRATKVLNALRLACSQDESDNAARQPWSFELLMAIVDEGDRAESKERFQTWVSRTRSAFDAVASGLGQRVVVTDGNGYRLGHGFTCVDRRLQAERQD